MVPAKRAVPARRVALARRVVRARRVAAARLKRAAVVHRKRVDVALPKRAVAIRNNDLRSSFVEYDPCEELPEAADNKIRRAPLCSRGSFLSDSLSHVLSVFQRLSVFKFLAQSAGDRIGRVAVEAHRIDHELTLGELAVSDVNRRRPFSKPAANL